LSNAEDVFDERAGEGTAEHCVGEGWSESAEAGELVGIAEDVVVERVKAALVLLREELGFVCGHVDGDGALGFAGLATEAEIEGLVDGLALEAFRAQRAGEHLPEQAGAAAGGVLLVAGGAVTGAHDSAFGLEACADSDTAGSGTLEGALVAEENEVSFKIGVLGAPAGLLARLDGAMAEVLDGIVDTNRIRKFSGVHAVVGIPDGLELAEGIDKLGAKHFGQKRSAGLTVAVFAGE
jgi:hypothetical protein